ncbi:hypothetical protein PV04_00937 [Phialophora macrospora]|uniref:DUF676 domain-containing protein n=1 Tax=Phialophora macrospora TaxID=1851006 RepID=A0A0D2EEM9_9EURO|nr:hypothetical protein PV04_00937 [Phialophora macrospora]
MDIDRVAESYETRRSSLQEDSDSAPLGQKNHDTATRTKITHVESGGFEVIGIVRTVAYGFWKGQTALLLAMRISFKSQLPGQRFKHAEVSASFAIKSKPRSKNEAIVRDVFYFDPNREGATYQVKAREWSSHGSSVFNEAFWTINERRGSSAGILDDLYVGVVVECTEAFQARVEVQAKPGTGTMKLRSWPWSKDDPLLFDLRTVKGPQPPTRTFEGFTTEDRMAIFQIDRAESLREPTPSRDPGARPPSEKRIVGQVLRVQGVPFHYDSVSFVKSFAAGAKLMADGILLRSFADNPYRREKTAVVSVEGSQLIVEVSSLLIQREPPPSSQHRPPIQDAIALSVDTDFIGFTALGRHEDTGPNGVDVIAVSGLGGHAYGSFKERGGSYVWLQDSMPDDIYSGMKASGLDSMSSVRVLTYGYNSRLDNSHSFQTIPDLANRFRNSLRAVRKGDWNRRYLILIGHSLGGLVIKEAIIQMSQGDETDKAHVDAILGCLFFGVPNRGMNISSLIPIVGEMPNRALLDALGEDSEVLMKQARDFREALPSIRQKIFSFYETMESPTAIKVGDAWKMEGPPTVLVNQESATHGRAWEKRSAFVVALNRTHSELVKFRKHDEDYEIVLSRANELLQEMKRREESAARQTED